MKVVFDYQTPSHSDVKAPYIEIIISDPLEKKTKILVALLDTGYDGELLVPVSVFSDLDLFGYLLDEKLTAVGESITGELFKMMSAYATLSIKGIETTIEIVVDSYKNCNELLIGRKLIENFSVILENYKTTLELKSE